MRTHALLLVIALASCGDDPKKKIGETCTFDSDCASGLCLEGRCLDPLEDEDSDGITNGTEGELGSNPLSKDSDLDGIEDNEELGTGSAPKNFDGDAFPDLVESARDDQDHDCIPDERDAVNATAETDAAVVANNACCCQGKCDSIGVSATATCDGGELTCNPAQPDRDGDGIADACDTPLLALSSADVEDGCAASCADVANNCPGQLDGCVAECVARASDEGMWLANYECFGVECSTVKCFDTPGFLEDANCRDACINVVGCDVGLFLGAGQDYSEPRCRAECAGQYQAEGDGVAALECLAAIDLPQDDCTLVDALPCVLGAQICTQACEKLAFPPGDSTCRINSPAYTSYATAALCTNACTDLSGYGEVSFLGCGALKGCSDFDQCAADPEPLTGCTAACSALATACPVPNGPFLDASLCEAFCTGIGLAAPWVDMSAAVSCISSTQGCDTNDEVIQTLSGCALTSSPDPRCVTACDAIVACAAELGEEVPQNCELGCTSLAINHPERIEPTFACVTDSASCRETMLCIPPAPDDVCPLACTHRLTCDPNYIGGEEQCVTDCKANIADDVDNLAAWMCESQARDCQTNCGELPGLDPEAACVTACAGNDTCIEAGYGLCARACQGVRRAYGAGTSNSCITEQLGRRCNATAVKACDPS